MSWDNAPWMIGGGVDHSVESARLVAYVASGGREGIVRPGDLKVVTLGTPGGGVRVSPGACAVINRTSGAFAQSYFGRNVGYDTVTIPSTGGVARTDLIIARIEDPFQPGNSWPVPSQAAKQTTPYIRTAVISNVDPATNSVADLGLNYSAIALARVTLPASTATVQAGHITDLRRMYAPQTVTGVNKIVRPGAKDTIGSDGGFKTWPSALTTSMQIPPWAVAAKCRIIFGQVGYGKAGNNGGAGWSTKGDIVVRIGSATDSEGVQYSLDSDAGVDRATLVAGTPRLNLPLSLRGTTQNLIIRANRKSGNTEVFVDENSVLSIELDFIEAPE